MASASEQGWQTEDGGQRATSLLIELKQRFYLLPWSLFLYAEGTEAEIHATFHTHVVTIQGSGLRALLVEFAGQTVKQVTEPDRTAKFAPGKGGPHITAVLISENK